MRRWLSAPALGLGALALVLIGAMVVLGRWQLAAYDRHQAQDARSRQEQPPTPLDRVLRPDAAFPADGVGKPVTVTGRYLAAEQIYVRGLTGSSDTYAVTTPLMTPAGSMILVVRGSTDRLAGEPPRGTVTVTGVLQPSTVTGGQLNGQRVADGLRISSLLEEFSRDLYSGYVVLTTSRPADPLPPVSVPLPESSAWAGLRNLLYAVQWWVFAGFVGFMWWRIVHDTDDSPPSGDDGAARDVGAVSPSVVR